MKRKVIQIAESTQLISLPRKWAIKHNIQKGAELDIEEQGNSLIIKSDSKPQLERIEIKLKDYGILAPRIIHALYKRGVDEIKIYLQSPKEFSELQNILSNETIGFEIIEQGNNYCVVRNVSGQIEEFDGVLRRTFLLLSNMANDGAIALKEKNQDAFHSLLLLEKSNNRFTSICRRYLNKYGSDKYDKIGPLYYIIEDMENVADEYKYLFQQLKDLKLEELKITPVHVEIYEKIAQMIKSFHELFYKNSPEKAAEIGKIRKDIVTKCLDELKTCKNTSQFFILHHALTITQKVFNMVGPFIVVSSRNLQS